MEGIIEALLDMEQKAEDALASVQREKDRLPARIAAEVDHACQVIAQEMDAAIRQLQEESKQSTIARIQAIQEDSANRLVKLELEFAKYREGLREELFKRLTTWNTMP